MALPWKLILTNVPWKDVLNQAPKIADGAKKLWGSMGRKNGGRPESSAMAETTLAADAEQARQHAHRTAEQDDHNDVYRQPGYRQVDIHRAALNPFP